MTQQQDEIMDKILDKINKYKEKLLGIDDENNRVLYQDRLDYYQGLKRQLNIDQMGLMRPTIANIKDYKLNADTPFVIKAIGYGNDHEKHPLVPMIFERRAAKPSDVVIEILYCGVCHSDWHVILNEWKNTKYSVITGHEVTGRVIKVGDAVKKFKVGDNVAVGPNYNSCRHCSQCKSGLEQYCLTGVTELYNMPDRRDDEYSDKAYPTGSITQGGYSNVITADEEYVNKIPDGAPLDKCSPLLCAASTMLTPLKELQIRPGQKVGIVGIGGLGHLGIKLAKSFGVHVVAMTGTLDKLSDCIKLGADQAIWTKDIDALAEHEKTFDLIIDTIPFNHDLTPYIKLIKPRSVLWIVGSFFNMDVDFNFVNRNGVCIRGSSTASIDCTQYTIDYCVKNNIYPEIQVIKMSDINKTHQNLITSKVKYRYVIDMSTIYQ